MEIRFNTLNNLPIIAVQLNGKLVKMLIDSGASTSIIDSTVHNQYNFKVSRKISKVSGIGGSRDLADVYDVCIEYRGVELKIPTLKTSDISGIRKALGVIGIIGSDFLKISNATVDYKNSKLEL